ncbi:MAG: hypothetical protein SH857_12650 [Chitinophagales bacterium]|nr:hypothetical protein [Chitinophagales bacterium]
MKHLFFFSCLFLLTSVATISKTPLHVEAINIDMNGELLIANSNNPDDPMKTIRVYTLSGQLVTSKTCLQSSTCTHNLSNLAAGPYLAVANSKFLQYSESILVK